MNGQLCTLAATVGAITAGALVLAQPAAADPWPAAYLQCSYELNHQLHKVSGECYGHTPFGDARGSLDGSLRPNGSAKGKLKLDSSNGSLDGSFTGRGFTGGTAKGTFTVRFGPTHASGNFVAWVG
jgi:hypothetical protein